MPGAWKSRARWFTLDNVTPNPNTSTRARRSGRAGKIIVSVIVIAVVLLAVAEFGLRAYMKNQVIDQVKSSAAAEGIELAGDPTASFGGSPVLLGLLGGRIPELTMEIPSSLTVSYQESDSSRPVITGFPGATITAEDVESSGDNPEIGHATVRSILPDDYLLASVRQAMTTSTTDEDARNNPFSGLLQVTGVTTDSGAGVLNIEISGGLATLSMRPAVDDGSLNFTVTDMKLLGLTLPDQIVSGISESLTRSVTGTEHVKITDATVTDDGLEVRLEGTDLRVRDIPSEVDAITVTTGGAATAPAAPASAV